CSFFISYSATCFLFLFFSAPVALPDLHSFPTRRSSDLSSVQSASISNFTLMPSNPLRTSVSMPRIPCRSMPASSVAFTERSWMRSEEHTSELQSRENLVCRLLLEKKNNTTYRAHRRTEY